MISIFPHFSLQVVCKPRLSYETCLIVVLDVCLLTNCDKNLDNLLQVTIVVLLIPSRSYLRALDDLNPYFGIAFLSISVACLIDRMIHL